MKVKEKAPKGYKKLNLSVPYWADVIKYYKIENNVTSKEVARRCLLSEGEISNIVSLKYDKVKVGTAEKLRVSLQILPEFKKRHANIARKGNKRLLMADVKKKMEKRQTIREYSKIERIFKKTMKFLKLKGIIK
jgi:hypothetical protein